MPVSLLALLPVWLTLVLPGYTGLYWAPGTADWREAAVTMLVVRAGSPPSAVDMLERFHRIHGLERLSEMWQMWEAWFADVEESHTSLPALVFFSLAPAGSLLGAAAGAVLDAASLAASPLDSPHGARADLCIRAGGGVQRRAERSRYSTRMAEF